MACGACSTVDLLSKQPRTSGATRTNLVERPAPGARQLSTPAALTRCDFSHFSVGWVVLWESLCITTELSGAYASLVLHPCVLSPPRHCRDYVSLEWVWARTQLPPTTCIRLSAPFGSLHPQFPRKHVSCCSESAVPSVKHISLVSSTFLVLKHLDINPL